MPIVCDLCNGPIIDYQVEFQSMDGALMMGSVVNETFVITGLQPYTNYSFQVAGMNDNGTGPFSDIVIIMTNEGSMCAVAKLTLPCHGFLLYSSWSCV